MAKMDIYKEALDRFGKRKELEKSKDNTGYNEITKDIKHLSTKVMNHKHTIELQKEVEDSFHTIIYNTEQDWLEDMVADNDALYYFVDLYKKEITSTLKEIEGE